MVTIGTFDVAEFSAPNDSQRAGGDARTDVGARKEKGHLMRIQTSAARPLTKRSMLIGAVLCVAMMFSLLPMTAQPAGAAAALPVPDRGPSLCETDDPNTIDWPNDNRVVADLDIRQGTNVTANIDTGRPVGQYDRFTTRISPFASYDTRFPSNASDVCFTFDAVRRGGGPGTNRVTSYGDRLEVDTEALLTLEPGVWDVSLEISARVAETFDGKIHRLTDRDETVVYVNQMPCGFVDSDGPLIGNIDNYVDARMQILPGLNQPADDLWLDPATGREVWTGHTEVRVGGSTVPRGAEVCSRLTVTRIGGGGSATLESNEWPATFNKLRLKAGRWNLKLEMIHSRTFEGTRYLESSDTTTATVTVIEPVGLPPISEPGFNIDAERKADVEEIVNALSRYGAKYFTHRVDNGGWRGNGQGWFSRQGGNYALSVANVLANEGLLKRTDLPRDPQNKDYMVYVCKNRVAVFAVTTTIQTSSSDQQWWDANGCSTAPTNTWGRNYMDLSQPIRCNGRFVTVDFASGQRPTSGNDVIAGTRGDDFINGLGGNDVICAGEGNDRVWGADGNDVILGGAGHDRLYSGRGHDVVWGGDGNDLLYNTEGNDYLNGRAGTDTCRRGIHFDRVASCELFR